MHLHLNKLLLAAMLLAACSLFIHLGKTPIYILDEARNAQCAWEMKEKKDLVTPVFNNELRGQKPPLHYYFMMAAYTVFGKTPFAARLFSALAGLLSFLVTYYYINKFSSKATAVATVVLLALSGHFLFECRLAVPDPYLILFQVLTLFSLYGFFNDQKTGWVYAAAVYAALSTLSKGPVAIALPGLIFLVLIASYKKWAILFNWHILAGIALYLLIAVPWFVLVHKATGGKFTQLFFFEHNINRFGQAMEGHGGFPGLALLIVVVGLLPGSVFLFTRPAVYKKMWGQPFMRFCIITTLVVVAFYSISATILPNYPMICYPFVACIAAFCCGQLTAYRSYLVPLFIIYLIFFAAAYIALGQEESLSSMRPWAFVFLIPVAALLLGILMAKKQPRAALTIAGCGIAACYCAALWFAYPLVYSKNPITSNIALINQTSHWGSFGTYNPSLNFYIQGPVDPLGDSAAIRCFLLQNKNALLVGREEDLYKLVNLPVKMVAIHKDLFENPTTVFLAPATEPFVLPVKKITPFIF